MSEFELFRENIRRTCRWWLSLGKRILEVIWVKLLDTISPQVQQANRLRHLALSKQQQGEIEPALKLLSQAAEIYRKHRSILRALDCYEELFQLYLLIGQKDAAMDMCEQTINYVHGRRFDWTVAQCHFIIANMLKDLEQKDDAYVILTWAKKMCQAENNKHYSAILDVEISEHLHQSGKCDGAIELLLSAAQILKDEDDQKNLASCYDLLAEVYCDSNEYEKAAEVHKLANELHVQNGDWKLALISKDLFLHGTGRADQIRLSNKHLALLDEDKLPNKWLNSHTFAMTLMRRNKYREARKFLALSLEVAEGLRSNLSQDNWRESFLEQICEVYFSMISVQTNQGQFWEALGYLEQLKSRLLVEKLAIQEDGTALGSMLTNIPVPSIRKLMQEYSEADCHQIAIFYIFTSEMGTEVFLLLNTAGRVEISHYPHSPFKYQELIHAIEKLEEFSRSCDSSNFDSLLDNVLTEIYAKVFSPILASLTANLTRIIFVPYGGFHLLPLHAMFTEENGHREYLIDKYVVTYAPSARILNYCKLLERSRNGRAFVGAADTLRNLHYSPYEAKVVADFLGTQVNHQTSRQDIIDKAQDAHIFHYTGHAEDHGLHLHKGQDATSVDLYRVPEIFATLELPEAWLVTLSACETGKVKIGKTDEYIGLPSAFLHAGAATVISSLWCVPERSTTLLMCKMYEFMSEGLGKADSLCQAQRWLKNSTRQEQLEALNKYVPWTGDMGAREVHDANKFVRKRISQEKLLPQDLHKPYYWAGFICTGTP